MASTSSSSTPPRKHDVFLSFRGEDTRKTIVDHLYYQLVQKGIHTFRDDKGLEKGRQIAELLPIIKESRFAIVVFSRNYASSKWCLEEIATIMECQQQYGEEIMIPIFYDVEPREVGNQTGSFGKSFAEHEKRFKDDKAKVKRWRKALKDASKISGYNLKNEFNGYEGVFITKVVGDILRRLPPPSGQQNLVGLKSQLAEIRKLLEMSSTDTKLILGICGMGGIGKTTLARAIFDNIFSEFDHFSFLYDVRTNKMEDLQVKLLNDSSIHPVLYEISTIKDRLKSKKVLIVLDDVDHKEQLDKLVEDGEWLREGSRVIITTRNKQLLNSFRVVKMKCYDVKKMDEGKALELFSRHAFGKEYPDKEFEDLSRDFVAYADGLPLALKLWGSALCTNDREFWKCTLEKIKSIPGGDLEVCQKLKISYDGLDEDQKKIFLNIACFFRHKRWDHVKDALESCGLHPGNGIKVLIKKCLLFESRDGNIDMHDLIQDMGWYVSKQEKRRTRLWQREDVVLCRNMKPKHKELIEGFLFSSTNDRIDDEKTLRAVKEMTNLKILIVGGADKNFPEVDNFLPSSLRWLEFPDYNSLSGILSPDVGNFLPRSLRWLDFLHYNSRSLSPLGSNPSELVGLCLPHSSLLNCRITKRLDNLTYLDLSYSRSLSKTPNFKWIPNLKRLYLSYCVELEKIHPSIGNLHKLVLLDLSNCYKLKNLPTFIQVSSLQSLKLEHCGALQNFPEIQTNMPDVEELNLESIGIEELPSSILKLCGLTKLRFCGCDYLVSLSDDLCEFKSLKILELRNCGQLESLPENLGNLSNLEELLIFDTAIFQLPPSITQLSSLECLCWGGNPDPDEERSLKFVPSVAGLCSLKRLQLSYFNIIDEGLPSDLEYLNSLEYLSLGDSNFVDLPESFSKLPCLQYLNIKGCRQLNRREEEEQPDLPKLPESTRELYADIRFASRRNITKLLAECPELHAVAFCNGGNDPAMRRPEYFLARMCTRFPLPRIPRETPFSVSYSVVEEHPDRSPDESLDTDAFRLFQYRCYQSNGISIDLTKHSWYCGWFVGFAVYFIYSGFDIWGPHSFKDIHCVERCTVIAKVSHNNNRNKDRQRECVIVNADDYTCEQIKGHICFVYIPFSSLCPESSTNTESVTAKDFSRFEVKFKNLEETADWGCSLLYYKRRKRLASRQDICSCSHRLPREKNICPDCAIHDLGPLPMLEYMNLSRQKFEDVPQYISKLHVIQYLDISGCLRVGELPELPLTLKELYAPCNRSLASENNITELATKYSELSSVSFSSSIDDNDDDRAFLKPRELAEKFIPITQPFLNRNTPFAVSYPNDDYKIGKCFKYTHNDSNKISISLDPTWYNHSFVGFVVCFQFPIKVRWESHPAIRPFRHCELIAKLTHKDINGSEPDPLQTKCVIGRLYDEEFYGEHGELVCFAYIPFSSLWPKYEVITDTTTPNRYSVFEAAFQDSEISKGISTDWSCGLLYTDDKSLIEELQQKRENGSSESDSEEEEEEEEEEDDEDEDEDDGSQHEDDAMTEDNNLGHSAESPIDISDDGSEPSEHGDSGKEGESIDCDEDVDEFESDAGHSSGAAMAKHRAEMQSNEGRGIRVKRSGVKTCIGSPPTKKRSHGLSPNVPFDGEEDGAGHGAEVAMSEYNDSVNEKGKERENEQRKKVRLNNDKAPSSSKQNRKIRDQSDELSPTGTQPPIVGDDVLQQMWDNFNCLLASFPLDEEYIKLEIDQTIFHHTDTCSTFMLITDIKDMMKMDFIDASIIKLFILFLNRLCNQFQVTSIGFVCPVEISMNEVKQNVPDITPYLTHVMEQHKNKQFILAPYLQKSHWLLLVICISSKSIYVLDPKPHNRTIEIKNNLNRALHSVSTNERNINWKPCKCPIQPGGVECGYYVMRYMFDIVTKYSSFECLDEAFESNNQYSINEIDEIRDLWAKYFLEECIQT